MIEQWVEGALAQANNHEARRSLQVLLKLDDLNFNYFLTLLQSKKSPKAREPLWIFDENQGPSDKQTAFPTALASPDMLEQLPWIDYESLSAHSKELQSIAKQATLWIKKMQAGSGSSVMRTGYLASLKGIPEKNVKLGAKGTDLFIPLQNREKGVFQKNGLISLAEAQILQAIADSRASKFKSIILHDLVSSETQESIRALWGKSSLFDPNRTYAQIAQEGGLMGHSGMTFQAYLPTFDAQGELSFKREAPGGHGLFALDALRAAYKDDLRPDTQGSPLISVVSNGEDLSSTPDAWMIGWMVKNKVPIAMVTTEKTPNDIKGGQIALVKSPQGSVHVTIVEQAQAKESGQLPLFENLGLTIKRGEQIAFFNTNMALFNYDVLTPLIHGFIQEVGENEFLKLSAPDLILNVKEQKDADGVVREYLQMEGAMGSSLLNLDRVWRERFGKPLVHFINVRKESRTDFFSPIKSAFDYFMQFHSDLFELDPETLRLHNLRPGRLPKVTLEDEETQNKFYQDVGRVLDCFEGTQIRGLDALNLYGKVKIGRATLKGKVVIRNERTGMGFPSFCLADYFTKNKKAVTWEGENPVLQNIKLVIRSNGELQMSPL